MGEAALTRMDMRVSQKGHFSGFRNSARVEEVERRTG